MDGLWDVADMAEFFNRVLRSDVPEAVRLTPNLMWQMVQARLLNMQNIARSQPRRRACTTTRPKPTRPRSTSA